MTRGCSALKLIAARRNLAFERADAAWERHLEEYTDPKTRLINGFKVIFEDGYFIFHFGGLEDLSQSLIKEHGPVMKAEAMGYNEV